MPKEKLKSEMKSCDRVSDELDQISGQEKKELKHIY